MLREVRWNSMVFILASRRVMALDTVAWDRASSAAALANEPVSATLAKIAHPSRSGSLFISYSRNNSRVDDSGCLCDEQENIGLAGLENVSVTGSMQKWKGWNSMARILRRLADP